MFAGNHTGPDRMTIPTFARVDSKTKQSRRVSERQNWVLWHLSQPGHFSSLAKMLKQTDHFPSDRNRSIHISNLKSAAATLCKRSKLSIHDPEGGGGDKNRSVPRSAAYPAGRFAASSLARFHGGYLSPATLNFSGSSILSSVNSQLESA